MDQYLALSYYHPDLTNAESLELLAACAPGSFLLRPHIFGHKSMSVSLMKESHTSGATKKGALGIALCIRTTKSVKHYVVTKVEAAQQWSLKNARPQMFSSLRQLIAHYTLNIISRKDGTCLAHPVSSRMHHEQAHGHGHGHASAATRDVGHEYADVLPAAFRAPTAHAQAASNDTHDIQHGSFLRRCPESRKDLASAIHAAADGTVSTCTGSPTTSMMDGRHRLKDPRAAQLKEELASFFMGPLSTDMDQLSRDLLGGADTRTHLHSGTDAAPTACSTRKDTTCTQAPRHTDSAAASSGGGDSPNEFYAELASTAAVNQDVLDKVRGMSEARKRSRLASADCGAILG